MNASPDAERPESESPPPSRDSSPATPDETPSPPDVTDEKSSTIDTSDNAENPDDDLPEWEPLTPELVEDEAIRGDFMLRWAVVLLAFLLACSEIAETSTLVHIKTGQYLAQNGILPPRIDVLSYTATDLPWINLEWLYDLLLAGVYRLSGWTGLTLWKGLLAALTFYIVGRAGLPGVSTWWNAIMSTMALIACFPHFTTDPHMVTLLGMAITIYCLHQLRYEHCPRSIYGLIVWFAVWTSLDRRMVIGLVILTLYALGEAARVKGNKSAGAESAAPDYLRRLWQTVAGSWGVALINPFGWHSWKSLYDLYAYEYPGMREHSLAQTPTELMMNFPLWHAEYWSQRNPYVIAALVVILGSVISILLNLKRREWGSLFAVLGMTTFAVLGGWELAPAAIVCCLMGNLSAQAWYRDNFRQTYSLDTMELLFSRGGRAVTVLVLFAIAYLGISGRMAGLHLNRVGFGLSPALSSNIKGYDKAVTEAFDDRPYHFRIDQGDVLIWLGQKSFIDNRVRLFQNSGDPSLLTRHDQIRRALRQPDEDDPATGRPDVWKSAFDQYEVSHVLPRLNGNAPDYRSFFDLQMSPDWQFVGLDASTGVFYRQDVANRELLEYLEKRRWNVNDLAYKDVETPISPRVEFVKPRSVYERYLTQPRNETPAEAQEAMHYLQLLNSQRVTPDIASSLSLLAIRSAQEALAETPRSGDAYLRLGLAYKFLGTIESQITSSESDRLETLRLYQSLMALHQALVTQPTSQFALDQLLEIYLQSQRYDLAMTILDRQSELTDNAIDITEEDIAKEGRNQQIREQISGTVQTAARTAADEIEKGTDRYQVAQSLYSQTGCVLEALRILDEDPVYVVNNPQAGLLRASLLLESGRLTEAQDQLTDIERKLMEVKSPISAQVHYLQGIIALGMADYERASQLWEADLREQSGERFAGMLATLPMVYPHVTFFGNPGARWPIQQSALSLDYLYNYARDTTLLRYHVARCYLEAGRLNEATDVFQDILEIDPETPMRRIVVFYLYLLTDEMIDPLPPSDWIPAGPETFAPEVPETPSVETNEEDKTQEQKVDEIGNDQSTDSN
ncbi:MAG: hypothetical protein O2955_17110 [Planctomycetota bacterium]|nr:hypothetical protein [Planctomycetota bacterium]MDA1214233.1 hypothetical protein [Planctomycetota bacterium]